MILLLQICLTVCAAARGWRWFAVVPLAAGVGLGFVLGFVGGFATGATTALEIAPLWVWVSFDVVVIGVLVFMVAVPPAGELDRVGTRVGTRLGSRIGTEI